MKIISGGQTGVDRAALDAAIGLGIEYGGSVAKGRIAEDGPIDRKYGNLVELEAVNYSARTEKNVEDADATLIFTVGAPTEGTAFTLECAKKHGRDYLVIDLKEKDDATVITEIRKWLAGRLTQVLNVAGPRESKAPGIYERVLNIFFDVFNPLT
ncbi:MAG TPA: putative molybdenum carrier protein [Dissulfurispiraceae bacterium]|nr:putative molybdenum carrier protein [Dissulfurispiraceae bacterium]